MRRMICILAFCVALALGAASSAQAATVNGYSGPLRATLHAGTHHPRISRAWPFTITASYAGHAARASAYYRYLFQGQVVSTQGVNGNFHFHFTGSYHDHMVFPSTALGRPLTVQAVIGEHGHTVYLNWTIQAIR
jgi:hypothetical protein